MTFERLQSLERGELIYFTRFSKDCHIKLEFLEYSSGENLIICRRLSDETLFYIFRNEFDWVHLVNAPEYHDMVVNYNVEDEL